MKYYVVSESDLLRALSAAEHVGTGPAEIRNTLLEMRDLAEAACRAREVVLTLGEMGTPNTWWEIKK